MARRLAHNLLFAGHIALLDGDPDKAATLLSASSAIHERLDVSGTPLDRDFAARLRADLEGALDASEFDAAWEEGQRLAVATAVGLATI